MFQAVIAIVAGLILLAQLVRGTLLRLVTPFSTVVGLLALITGLFSLVHPLGIALLLAGLVLAMHTLYSVPSFGARLKEIGLWLSRFRLPLGLANLALGLAVII